MNTLVIAEHDNTSLMEDTLHCITAAKLIGEHIDVLVAGFDCIGVAKETAKLNGVSNVLIADDKSLEHQFAEMIAPLIQSMKQNYSHIFSPATEVGNDLIPRLAALLDVQPISNVCGIESPDTFKRPIYSGDVIATVKLNDKLKVGTVSSSAFAAANQGESIASVCSVEVPTIKTVCKIVSESMYQPEHSDFSRASIIISGGRGLRNIDNFLLLCKIADKLGAAVGGSRAAIDAGYVTTERLIGQSGKHIAPDLYIAVGISGAIQHIAGIKNSKVIVAINNNENAPIFEVADYGLVADLEEALPKLESLLSQRP